METLLNCPFCDGEAYIDTVLPHTHTVATFMPDYEGGSMVACSSCHVAVWREGKDAETAAVSAWNTRTAKEPKANEY